jgi:hypothetical protein
MIEDLFTNNRAWSSKRKAEAGDYSNGFRSFRSQSIFGSVAQTAVSQPM